MLKAIYIKELVIGISSLNNKTLSMYQIKTVFRLFKSLNQQNSAADTMVQIYSNIMNFEQRLEFPEDDDWKLSDEGVSLIRSLICKQRVR